VDTKARRFCFGAETWAGHRITLIWLVYLLGLFR